MKDKHGVQRGRCKEEHCECEQYWPPPLDSVGGKLYCEYCNHLPGKHLRIVPLGACSGCGQKDNCTKYEPANDWSYTECQYCGCNARCHEGAEHLAPSVGASASPGVKLGPSGTPTQTYDKGQCKYPGCAYGRWVDPTTGHVSDYCSRTCAKNDSARQSSSISTSTTSGASSGAASLDPGLLKQLATHVFTALQGSSATTSVSSAPSSVSSNQNPPSASSAPLPQSSSSIRMCTKCNTNQANPGRKWCQKCFLAIPSNSTPTS